MITNRIEEIPQAVRENYECTFEADSKYPRWSICRQKAQWWVDGDAYCDIHKQFLKKRNGKGRRQMIAHICHDLVSTYKMPKWLHKCLRRLAAWTIKGGG